MARHEKSTRRGGALPLAMARAFWRQRRYPEALRSFSEAVRQAPTDLAVLFEAAQAFATRYQPGRAAQLLERGLRLGARRYDVQREAGRLYMQIGQTATAEACFRRACQLAGDPHAHLELARLFERQHALDAADAHVTAALKSDPHSLRAWLLRARIERRRGSAEQAYATLRRVLAAAHPAAPELPELYGELCTVLDSLGNYDAAWDAMLEGKRLQRSNEADAWAAAQFVMRRCAEMYDDLTPDHLARWTTAPPAGEPRRVALLTGFPRSGTTLLEQVLDAHPGIVSSEEKGVFGADVLPLLGEGRPPDAPLVSLLDAVTPDRVAEARSMYLDAMQGMLGEPLGERVHLDKNPAMSPMIPAMRRVFPELNVLVALRDPRDVVASCFLRWLPVNGLSVWFLTLERCVDRYIMDLEGWLRVRDMLSQWTEIRYEDLVTDLPGQAKRALAALSASWDDAVLNYRDRNKLVASPTYEAVAQPVYTSAIGRWRRYEKQLAPVLDRLAPLIQRLGYDP